MRCFVCKMDGPIQQFTKKTYEKCRLILMFRREKHYKYSDVRLDSEIAQNHGYHASCYKRIAISSRVRPLYKEFCKSHETSDVLLVPAQENLPITAGDLKPPSPVVVQQQQQPPSIIITVVSPENSAQEPPSAVLVTTMPQTVAFIPVESNEPIISASPVPPTKAVLNTIKQQSPELSNAPKPSTAFIPMELSVPTDLAKTALPVAPAKAVLNRAKQPASKRPIPPKPPAAAIPVELSVSTGSARTTPSVPPMKAVLNLDKELPSEVLVATKLPPAVVTPVELSEPTAPTKTALPVPSTEAILNLVKEPPSEVPIATKPPTSITLVELSEQKDPAKIVPPVPRMNATSLKRIRCTICGCMEKKVQMRRTWVTFPPSEESLLVIAEKAKILNDTRIVENLKGTELVAFHDYCYDLYLKRVEPKVERPEEPEQFKELHASAFNALSFFITQEVIKKGEIVYLDDLLLRYKAILLDFGTGEVSIKDFDNYQIDSLERKIMSAFRDRITIQSSTLLHQKKIVYMRGMDATRFAKEVAKLESSHKNAVIELIGSELRNAIVTAETHKVPEKNRIDDIFDEECEISQELMEFMTDIIVDPTIHNLEKDDITKLRSACSDLIYAATEGKVKPSRELPAGVVDDAPENPMFKMLDQYRPTVDCDKSSELHGKTNNGDPEQVNVNNKRCIEAEFDALADPLTCKKRCLSENTVDN